MTETLFDKLWDAHRVAELPDRSDLIFIDRVFLHERTGSIALTSMAENGRKVRNPKKVFCTMDHIIDTFPGRDDSTLMPGGTEFIVTTRQAAKEAGIQLFDINDPDQGISHLVSAEQGIALPGLTLVCPDSHTCTLGAMGALALGIGSSDCEHALATETLRLIKPKQMRVNLNGNLGPGVSAKDVILTLIRTHGAAGGKGMAIEFRGPVVDALGMEGRFTLCNMATEFSAFTAVIAPDAATIDYVKSGPKAPSGEMWTEAVSYWKKLHTAENAQFDEEIYIDCSRIEPMVSWGTSPEQTIGISESTPKIFDTSVGQGSGELDAFEYMDLSPGQPVSGLAIQGAFIGSCTNGRLSDLLAAAEILRGRKVSPNIKAICTPGSARVKREAEALGLNKVFTEAGFEWREPGCSLCFYAGGEGFKDGERVISTTNRNFKGRQGRGTRTHISSPAMVAAAAIAGKIVDCRIYHNTNGHKSFAGSSGRY